MRLGFKNVVGRSLKKALRDVGITAATVAGIAGLSVLGNPEVLAPLAAALPSAGGTILLIVAPILAKAAIDAIKHSDKM